MFDATTVSLVGGEGGAPFTFTGENNGASLEKIWVWVGKWQIKAVRVWLTDGRNAMFGKQSGRKQQYMFKPGETFTRLSLWGNGEGTRLGAIRFKTSQGGKFFAKMTEWSLKQKCSMNVGSGLCLGVVGRCGADIDSMGFMFLNAVQSTVLTNVDYPTISQLIPNVTVKELESIPYQNDSPVKQQQTIETSKKVTKQSSWSMSNNFTATFSVKVKAGIPEVMEVSSGFSFSVGKESIYNQVHKDKRTETLSTSVEIPPKSKVDVSITFGRSTFELPYTGTLMIFCKNGGFLFYETEGTYKGVTYTDIKVKTKESAL